MATSVSRTDTAIPTVEVIIVRVKIGSTCSKLYGPFETWKTYDDWYSDLCESNQVTEGRVELYPYFKSPVSELQKAEIIAFIADKAANNSSSTMLPTKLIIDQELLTFNGVWSDELGRWINSQRPCKIKQHMSSDEYEAMVEAELHKVLNPYVMISN